uniref:Secreted protein n=1 Tax=Cyprinus carpio TaxID=7962 RepID=A0A8C1SPV4_CYPCA
MKVGLPFSLLSLWLSFGSAGKCSMLALFISSERCVLRAGFIVYFKKAYKMKQGMFKNPVHIYVNVTIQLS